MCCELTPPLVGSHPLFSICSLPNPPQIKPETSFTLSLECCLGSLWSDSKAAELFLAAPHQFCVPVGSSTWGDSAYKYWRGFTFRDDILIRSAKSYGPTCRRLMKELLWLVERAACQGIHSLLCCVRWNATEAVATLKGKSYYNPGKDIRIK